jgi:hypothetical protein
MVALFNLHPTRVGTVLDQVLGSWPLSPIVLVWLVIVLIRTNADTNLCWAMGFWTSPWSLLLTWPKSDQIDGRRVSVTLVFDCHHMYSICERNEYPLIIRCLIMSWLDGLLSIQLLR